MGNSVSPFKVGEKSCNVIKALKKSYMNPQKSKVVQKMWGEKKIPCHFVPLEDNEITLFDIKALLHSGPFKVVSHLRSPASRFSFSFRRRAL